MQPTKEEQIASLTSARIETLKQQNAELLAALRKCACLDNVYRDAHERRQIAIQAIAKATS